VSAGIAPPPQTVVSRHISPGLQRILDRLADTPVGVFTASWDLIFANPLCGGCSAGMKNVPAVTATLFGAFSCATNR